MATKKKVQTTDLLDLDVPPSRVIKFANELGLNKTVESSMNTNRDVLMKIRKEGGPSRPASLPRLRKSATLADRAAHEEAKAKYAEDLKTYNKFTSSKFVELKRVYETCKILQKLADVYTSKMSVDVSKKNSDRYVALIRGQTPEQWPKEDTVAFIKMVNKYAGLAVVSRVGDVDLTNPNALTDAVSRLVAANPEVEFFMKKDNLSRTRVRFGSCAAVVLATVAQSVAEEIVNAAAEHAIDRKETVVQPEHAVAGLSTLSSNCFVSNLPNVRFVNEKILRRRAYLALKTKAHQRFVHENRAKAKVAKSAKNKTAFEFPTFSEFEVQNGFAVSTTKPNKNGKNYVIYQWKSLAQEEAELDFIFSVKKICNKVVEARQDAPTETELENGVMNLKFSKKFKMFISNVIVELVVRICCQCKLLTEYAGAKTIDHDCVFTVVKQVMMDAIGGRADMNYLPEHQQLIDRINSRMDIYRKHKTQINAKMETANEPSVEVSEPQPRGLVKK